MKEFELFMFMFMHISEQTLGDAETQESLRLQNQEG